MSARLALGRGLASFDEDLHPRGTGGLFASKGGGDHRPTKTTGLTGSDVIEALQGSARRLHGRTIGDVLARADDPQALLRALAQRFKAGEIQFRDGGAGEALSTPHLGTPYTVSHDEIHDPGRHDTEEFEAHLERQAGKARSDQIVVSAELPFDNRGRVDQAALVEDLLTDAQSGRNRPSFMRGELGHVEDSALREALTKHVKTLRSLTVEDHGGDTYMVTLDRPADAPYHKARAAAERAFRAQGLSEHDIAREMNGTAEHERDLVRSRAEAAAAEKTYAETTEKLREYFPDEVDMLPKMSHRNRFVMRSRLLKEYKKKTGVDLPYGY
ncbi:hypothetical protein [Methylobacterium sp. JK268]